MIRDPFHIQFRHAAFFASLACLIANLPLRADTALAAADPIVTPPLSADAAATMPPTPPTPEVASPPEPLASNSTSAPILVSPNPILRPMPLPDDSSATAAPATTAPADPQVASNAAPSTTPDSSAPATASESAPATPSQNVTINLINLMVKRGLITKDDAADLIKQAEEEAKAAREDSAIAQAAAAKVQEVSAEQAGAATPGAPIPAVPADGDTVNVSYVPDVVKQQIRDEVKEDVMKQARDENWAAPNAVPDWVHRYHVSADLRVRYEGDFFPGGNDDSGVFHNFNAINTGAPFDTGADSVAPNPPSYDVNANRDRFRLRARFGAGIDVGDNFTAGLRIGTGQDDNPVTENQTLGLSNNGQGGDFSKYAVWLDRAFLRYELGGAPDSNYDLSATIGRFDNPFFSSTMIWANDIGFDGIAVHGSYKAADGVTPFFTVGAFPVYNTDLNFASTSAVKYNSEDKYLYAVQGGTTWQISKDISFKGGLAMYYFYNIEGKVSDPFVPEFSSDQGNTDDSRPSFAQNGNTYIALRNITPNATNDFGGINQWQYYGLATPFHEGAVTSQLDFSQFDPFHIMLQGEFVKNFAFDRNAILSNGPPQQIGPVNNLTSSSDINSFNGGDMGYNMSLNLGAPTITKLWDWNVNLTYRYIQSDAVVDGFTDADFGGPLTGTNLKGYILGAKLGLSPRVWSSVQWMSSDAIAGPVYKNDLIQIDLNAKF